MDTELIKSVLKDMPGKVCAFNWNGEKLNTIYANPETLELLGLNSAEDFPTDMDQIQKMIHPEDRPKLGDRGKLFLQESFEEHIKLRIYNKERKNYIWVRFDIKNAKAEDDTWLVYVAYTDIDYEKELEKRLESEEEAYWDAVDLCNGQCWEHDLKKDVVTIRSRSAAGARYSQIVEDFPDTWMHIGYIHPDDEEDFLIKTRMLKSGIDNNDFDIRLWNPAKESYVWKRIKTITLFDGDGTPDRAISIVEDIGDYKDLQETIQSVMEMLDVAYWELDVRERRVIHTSDGLHKLLGDVPIKDIPESLEGERFVHPDDVKLLREGYRRVFDGEKEVSFQCRYWVSNVAQYRWFETSYTVIADSDGKPARAIGTARDIEHQKKIDEEYQNQLDYMNELTDASLVAKGRHNITQNKVEFSVEMSESAVPCRDDNFDDFTKRLASKALSEEKREELSTIFSRKFLMDNFVKGINTFSVEYQRKSKDNKTMYVLTNLKTFRRPGSTDVMCFAYTYDMTDSKLEHHVISKVAGMEYDFLGVLEIATKTFRLLALKGGYDRTITDDYPYDERWEYGLPKEIVPEQRAEVIANMNMENVIRRLEESETYFFTFTMVKDGERLQKKVQFAYLDEAKERIMFTRSDITEIYEAEQEQLRKIERALDEAREANSAKSQFLSRISHDLRTPMNAILGLSNLGLDTDDVGELHEYMGNILSSGKYLLNLINDTLDLNRIESGHLDVFNQDLNLLSLLEPVSMAAQIMAEEKGVGFRPVISVYPGAIKTDSVKLRRILNNLLSNAIKFTPEGGYVTFIAEEIVEATDIVYHQFVIIDTGVGMSPEFMDKMYEPFVQAQDTATVEEGSGLGLTIVQKLVGILGGEIRVESEQGRGTTFSLSFKFEKAENEPEEKNHGQMSQDDYDAFAGKHILVCEDHPLNVVVVRRLLEKVGCTVTTAENGQVGVDLFRESPPGTFDAVLMDIRMPVMNGLDAAEHIREMDKEVPIIALSANAENVDEEKSSKAGMNAHLSKPVEPDLMYKILKKFMFEA